MRVFTKSSDPMKRISILLLSLLFPGSSAFAQIHLFLQEQDIKLSDGTSSAWVLPVARDIDEALNDLKNYCKDRSDVRMRDGGRDLVIAEKVSIPTLATKRGDLIGYGFTTENYDAVALIFQMGYDISVNSREWALEMSNFRNYSREFMSYHYEQSYARRIEVLDKEIKSLEREKRQNENKIENLGKKVTSNEKKIDKETDTAKVTEFESEITTLRSDIQELEDTLPVLQNQIEQLHVNSDKLKNESLTYQSAIGSL